MVQEKVKIPNSRNIAGKIAHHFSREDFRSTHLKVNLTLNRVSYSSTTVIKMIRM